MTLPADMVERLRELLERVERSRGSDDDLRKDILIALDPEYAGYDRTNIGGARRILDDLDDAYDLVERVIPGMHWRVERSCEYPALAFRNHRYSAWAGNYGTPSHAEGATPALALLAALLRSIQGEK